MADSLSILSLYSGSGYLDEAVRAALRAVWSAESRVLGYVEREAHAAALLLARMEAAAVERAPIFCGDIADLDARSLCGHVDIVCASPPCQPYSSAGKRRGNDDERSWGGDGRGPLWNTIRIIRECRPALVYLENVRQWVTDGHFREFGEQLCELGFDIAPPLFLAAEDVGATHERERVFILAYSRRDGGEFRRIAGVIQRAACAVESAASERKRLRNAAGTECRAVGDAAGARREEARGGKPQKPERRKFGLELGRGELGDADGRGRWPQSDAGIQAGRIDWRSGNIPMFPPGRDDYGRWAALLAGGLDPALAPAIESGVSVVADGLGRTADLLRLGGNGVVPLQAGIAFAILLDGILRGWGADRSTEDTEGTEVKT